MLRPVLICMLLYLATCCFGQTRKLAHHSHAGDTVTFAMVMDEDRAGLSRFPVNLPMEDWDVSPFVDRLKAHYLRLQQGDSIQSAKSGLPQEPNSKLGPDAPSKESNTSKQTPIKTADNQISPPEFLVGNRTTVPQHIPMAGDSILSRVLGYLLLIGIPVAIGLAFLGAMQNRKSPK